MFQSSRCNILCRKGRLQSNWKSRCASKPTVQFWIQDALRRSFASSQNGHMTKDCITTCGTDPQKSANIGGGGSRGGDDSVKVQRTDSRTNRRRNHSHPGTPDSGTRALKHCRRDCGCARSADSGKDQRVGKVIQERVSEPVVDQIVNIPVPQIIDDTVDMIQDRANWRAHR